MITKEYGKDFKSDGGALTLSASEVEPYTSEWNSPEYSKTHPDGWIITAKVQEDYYEWINDFKAEHPIYGKVWGNFQDKVYADSEEGYQHFYKNHTPNAWDYGDI